MRLSGGTHEEMRQVARDDRHHSVSDTLASTDQQLVRPAAEENEERGSRPTIFDDVAARVARPTRKKEPVWNDEL
jgi:hypothetical protein